MMLLCTTVEVVVAQSGSLDSGFGNGGKVTTPIGTSHDYATAVAIQSDGKIILVGDIWNFTTLTDFGLCRYNTNGTLDNSFGTSGKVITVGGTMINDEPKAVCVQPDGKIVVAGSSYTSGYSDFAVYRYKTDGTPDTSFGSGGQVYTNILGYGYANAAALQQDGKIVVAGYTVNVTDEDIAVVRYNTEGIIDSSFGTNGIVVTPILTWHDRANALTIQPDGKIIVAGYSRTGTADYFALVRYTSNGALDNTFDTNGIVTTRFPTSFAWAYSVACQSDGKIVVAGNSNADFALARYNTNGSIDSSFGSNGLLTTPIGSSNDYAYSAAIQSDGKIIAAGYSFMGSNSDFSMARYNADGSPDITFGTNGTVVTPVGTTEDWGTAMVLQTDSKILVAGWSNNGTDADFAVVRYNNVLNSGISKSEIKDIISAYPNPASDKVTLENFSNEKINYNFSITNMLGMEMIKGQVILESKHIIDVSQLKDGIYLLIIQSNNQKYIRKLIISN